MFLAITPPRPQPRCIRVELKQILMYGNWSNLSLSRNPIGGSRRCRFSSKMDGANVSGYSNEYVSLSEMSVSQVSYCAQTILRRDS